MSSCIEKCEIPCDYWEIDVVGSSKAHFNEHAENKAAKRLYKDMLILDVAFWDFMYTEVNNFCIFQSD